jgi:hypothetical protein
MCKLSDQCADSIINPLETVTRPGFFPSVEDSYVYCGFPDGYREHAKV